MNYHVNDIVKILSFICLDYIFRQKLLCLADESLKGFYIQNPL